MTDNDSSTTTDASPDNQIQSLERRVAELEAMTEVDSDADGGGLSLPDLLDLGLTRRQALMAIALVGAGWQLGPAITKSISEPAAASHGGATLGTQDNPLEAIYVHDLYNTTDNIAADSITTERPVTTILADDDAQNKIESASKNTYFVIEPGATHQITPPFDPPANIVLDAGPNSTLDNDTSDDQGTGPNVVFEKAGDGDMLSVPDNLTVRGILFDGQKSTYTGDGLVDAYWDVASTRLIGCRIQNMAGHGRVHDAASYCTYVNLKIWDCDGAAIRNISTDHDGFRRSTVNGLHVDNCQHAVLTEAATRYIDYDNIRTTSCSSADFKYEHPSGESVEAIRIHGQLTNAGGPAIHNAGHFINGMELSGLIFGCDGPAIYVDSTGGMRQLSIEADVENVAGSVGVSVTSPLGQVVHLENTGSDSRITCGTANWASLNASSSSVLSNQSGNVADFTVVDTECGGSTTADGNLTLVCLNTITFGPGNAGNFNGNELLNVT